MREKQKKEANKIQASKQTNNNNNKNLSSGAAELVHAAAGSGALAAIQMQPWTQSDPSRPEDIEFWSDPDRAENHKPLRSSAEWPPQARETAESTFGMFGKMCPLEKLSLSHLKKNHHHHHQ